MRPILYGILASFFFSATFVLNQAMKLAGGSWMYTASLRFIFMLPFLLLIVSLRGNLPALLKDMRQRLRTWLWWSFVGFGVMYAPVCYATQFEPGWLIAGTWQITIVAGVLLAPLFYRVIDTPDGPVKIRQRVHWNSVWMSLVILLGIAVMQSGQAGRISAADLLLGAVPVAFSAFAYPLGNRKMMEVCEGRLDAYQRVLGMVIASLPLWIVLSAVAFMQSGLPSPQQTGQSLLVAFSSGVVATVLFFSATDMAKGSAQTLAAVEATQSGEVVFAAAGELLLLPVPLPPAVSWIGMFLVIAGMTLHSVYSGRGRSAAGAVGKKGTLTAD
ncbi:multidrug resistance efflux transporter family protein [Paenibacillus humicola]|uniref:DMT family transporter n=1 Tax=Paenibacillus humicola TaxID=3110540 RepID=UPI00237B8D27|nr:multidrug resistance efflux transporter family protein [Paenibacillus humicola]